MAFSESDTRSKLIDPKIKDGVRTNFSIDSKYLELQRDIDEIFKLFKEKICYQI